MAASKTNKAAPAAEQKSRRDFIVVATYAMGAVGAGAFAWPLIDQMNPAADTLALASIEVDVSKIAEGQSITLKWRGKPVFIRHRTKAEIDEAKVADALDMRDPQADDDRVQKPEYLVVLGVCTHLGCVPLLARKWARFAANMMAGSARAMAHTMIHQAGFAKARPRPIWKCRLTPSSQMM